MKIKLISHQTVLKFFKTKVRDEYYSSNSSKIKWSEMLSTFYSWYPQCYSSLTGWQLLIHWCLFHLISCGISEASEKKLILKWNEWKGNLLFESPCVLWCVCFLQDSFQMLKKWVKELKEHGPEDIVVAIAGNKTDLGDIRFKPSSSFWKCIILSKVSFQNLQPLSLYFHISCRMWSFYLKSTWNQNCRSN